MSDEIGVYRFEGNDEERAIGMIETALDNIEFLGGCWASPLADLDPDERHGVCGSAVTMYAHRACLPFAALMWAAFKGWETGEDEWRLDGSIGAIAPSEARSLDVLVVRGRLEEIVELLERAAVLLGPEDRSIDVLVAGTEGVRRVRDSVVRMDIDKGDEQ